MNLNRNNCRICLVECENEAMEMSVMSKDFQELTGFYIIDSDPPQKICENCASNLKRLKEFINLCRLTEEHLIRYRNQCLSDSLEDEKIFPTEHVFVKLESPCDIESTEMNRVLFESECDEIENIYEKPSINRIIICELCNEEFKEDQLKRHIKHFHIYLSKYQCDLCQTFFNMKGDLRKHMKLIHIEKKKTKIKDRKPRAYKKREKTVVSKTVTCEICSLEMNRKEMKKHIKLEHAAIKPLYQCDLCKKFLKNKRYVRHHLKTVHVKAEQYPCEYCGRIYQSKNTLNVHLKTIHLNTTEHKCETCNKTFLNITNLKQHYMSHMKEPSVPCPICGIKFRSLYHANHHKNRVHIEKKLKCHFCEKRFKHKTALKSHEERHLPRAYQCPVCQRAFSNQQTLIRHVRRLHPDYKMPPKGTSLKNVDINQIKRD